MIGKSQILSVLVSLLVASTTPVTSQGEEPGEATGPALVLQVKSPANLLEILKTTAKNFLPDSLVKDLEIQIFSKLDLKKLKGVDTSKPMGLYGRVGDKFLQGDFSTTLAVLCIPIADEKAFLDGLTVYGVRITKTEGEIRASIPQSTVSARIHFQKGHANLVISQIKIETTALLDPGDIFDAGENGVATLTLRVDRLPEDVRKLYLDRVNVGVQQQLTDLTQRIKQLNEKEPLEEQDLLARKEMEINLLTQQTLLQLQNQILTSANRIIARLGLDPQTGMLSGEVILEPKEKTELAKSIAAFKPTSNTVVDSIATDSAGHLHLQLPLFFAPFQNYLLTNGLRIKQINGVGRPNDFNKELIAFEDALFKTLSQTVKEGALDLAASLRGPDADNHFTAVVAITLKDGGILEKTIRPAWNVLARDLKDRIHLEAFTVKDTPVHEFAIQDLYPRQLGKLFGPGALWVALTPKAVILTMGSNGKAVIQDVLMRNLEPRPAPLLNLEVSGKRILAVGKAFGAKPEDPKLFAKIFVGERTPLLSLKVEGGKKLLLRGELEIPWLLALFETADLAPPTLDPPPRKDKQGHFCEP